jgi:uncharacterized membrane protein YphA (DoxX/SURF4 family)
MPSFLDHLGAAPVEHGSSRLSRWLQERWLSLAGAIAIAEGIFVLLGPLSQWIALAVAVVLLVAYFRVNRTSFSPGARIAARIVALSQFLVLFVPLLIGLVYAVAIFTLVVVGIVVIAALLRRR